MGLIALDLQKMLSAASFHLNLRACILNQTYQTPGAIARTKPLTPLARRVKKSSRRMQQCSKCGKLSGIGSSIHACMKIERHGQAKILTQQEIELLFNKGLQTDRDRTLFGGKSLHGLSDCRSLFLMVKDIYTNSSAVRSTINGRFRQHQRQTSNQDDSGD